ncbi:MAG TPA: hypothetical protein VF177_15460 [Anaerolineae bacterium]
MNILRFLGSTISVLAAAVTGNWLGSQLRFLVLGEPGHQMRFSHTTLEGDTMIAINPTFTNLIPALLAAFIGRPRWLYALAAGIAASAFIGDRYEQRLWNLISRQVTGEAIYSAET